MTYFLKQHKNYFTKNAVYSFFNSFNEIFNFIALEGMQ